MIFLLAHGVTPHFFLGGIFIYFFLNNIFRILETRLKVFYFQLDSQLYFAKLWKMDGMTHTDDPHTSMDCRRKLCCPRNLSNILLVSSSTCNKTLQLRSSSFPRTRYIGCFGVCFFEAVWEIPNEVGKSIVDGYSHSDLLYMGCHGSPKPEPWQLGMHGIVCCCLHATWPSLHAHPRPS